MSTFPEHPGSANDSLGTQQLPTITIKILQITLGHFLGFLGNRNPKLKDESSDDSGVFYALPKKGSLVDLIYIIGGIKTEAKENRINFKCHLRRVSSKNITIKTFITR